MGKGKVSEIFQKLLAEGDVDAYRLALTQAERKKEQNIEDIARLQHKLDEQSTYTEQIEKFILKQHEDIETLKSQRLNTVNDNSKDLRRLESELKQKDEEIKQLKDRAGNSDTLLEETRKALGTEKEKNQSLRIQLEPKVELTYTTQDLLERARADNRYLRGDIRELEASLRSEQKGIKGQKEEISRLKSQLRDLRGHQDHISLPEKLGICERENHSLKKEIGSMRKSLHEQMERSRIIYNKTDKSSSRWLPNDDHHYISQASKIQRAIINVLACHPKMQSNLNSPETLLWKDELDKEGIDEVLEELRERGMLHNKQSAVMFDDYPSIEVREMLIMALYGYHLHTTFFSNPFFFLGPTSDILNKLYRRAILLSPDVEVAHTWRSDTLRLFRPEIATELSEMSTFTIDMVKKEAEQELMRFLEGPVRRLITFSENDVERLSKVFMNAADVAYRLWWSRKNITVGNTHTLGGEIYIEKNDFEQRMSPQIVEPHELCTVQSERTKEDLVGKKIVMAVYPSLVGYGEHVISVFDKQDYDQLTVAWGKATVWFDLYHRMDGLSD